MLFKMRNHVAVLILYLIFNFRKKANALDDHSPPPPFEVH